MGLAMESFIYAHSKLLIHLSLFFTFCVRHHFLPASFMELVITPVIKNKGGDLTDINNYRAIAISNADTKILEKLLLPFMTSLADCDNYQFGFKAGHSTTLYAGVFRHTVFIILLPEVVMFLYHLLISPKLSIMSIAGSYLISCWMMVLTVFWLSC